MTKYIVRYTGPEQHTRILSASDELKNGLILPRDLEWGPGNRHTEVLEELDEEALAWFRQTGNDFSVREVPDEKADEVEGAAGDAEPSTDVGEVPEGVAGLAPEGDTGTTGAGTAGRGRAKKTAGSR